MLGGAAAGPGKGEVVGNNGCQSNLQMVKNGSLWKGLHLVHSTKFISIQKELFDQRFI